MCTVPPRLSNEVRVASENADLKRELADVRARLAQLEAQSKAERSAAEVLEFLARVAPPLTGAPIEVTDEVAASFAGAFAELD